jgi:8-oxo-dGTP pyrophosphatase MutT (NUDIX family)
MGKVVSCGVVMVNARREVFACHATGTPRWDLPKGMQDPGESAIQTALREVWEETSLALEPEWLNDLGLYDYPKSRAHHLHGDAIQVDAQKPVPGLVVFEPFVGIAPRQYQDIFDARDRRKDSAGRIFNWRVKGKRPQPRFSRFRNTYRDRGCRQRPRSYDSHQLHAKSQAPFVQQPAAQTAMASASGSAASAHRLPCGIVLAATAGVGPLTMHAVGLAAQPRGSFLDAWTAAASTEGAVLKYEPPRTSAVRANASLAPTHVAWRLFTQCRLEKVGVDSADMKRRLTEEGNKCPADDLKGCYQRLFERLQ